MPARTSTYMADRIPKPPSDPLRIAREREEARERARRGGASGRVIEDAREPFGVKVSLDIPIEEIQDGLDVEETLPKAWLENLLDDPADPPWRAAGDAEIDLSLQPEASTVKVTGEGRFPLVHSCVRCLRDVHFDLDVDFDVRLAPGIPDKPLEALMDEEEEMDLDDVDAIDPAEADLVPFDGRVVHLPAIMREQIFLDLPMHPACETEGAKPPEGPCTLDPEGALEKERGRWQDPRWAGLRALKDQLPPGSDSN